MTITDTSNVSTYTGDAVTDTFSTVFIFFESADLVVKVADVLQVLDTDYTVTGGDGLVGSVVFTSAPASSAAIVIERVVDYEQQTDFENFDGNPADVTEKQFDLVVMQTQQLKDAVARSITVEPGTASFDGEVSVTGNGGKFLQLKSDLTGYTFSTALDTSDVTISTLGETLIADTTETAMRQTLLFPAQSASKRGAVLVQNDTDDGYEQIDSQGTSGQVLTSNGADALPSYQTAASGGAWTLLSTQTASASATIDFTSDIDSTYKAYKVIGSVIIPATNNVALYCRLSESSTFQTASYAYRLDTVSGTSSIAGNAGSATEIRMSTGGVVDSTYGTNFELTLYDPNVSNYTHVDYRTTLNDGGTTFAFTNGAGSRQNAAAVDGIRFYFSSGNVASGTLKLYGIS